MQIEVAFAGHGRPTDAHDCRTSEVLEHRQNYRAHGLSEVAYLEELAAQALDPGLLGTGPEHGQRPTVGAPEPHPVQPREGLPGCADT